MTTEHQPTFREIREALVAKGASAEQLEEFDADVARLRAKLQPSFRANDLEKNLKTLRGEAETLASTAVRQQEDVEAAERRAAPLLAEADRMVSVYREALALTAKRRAEMAEQMATTERELQHARKAEAEALFGDRRAS